MSAQVDLAGWIRPEISHLAAPIDSVHPYPGNARRGDTTQLTASLTTHGQYKPLLVQASTGHVLVGNNTWHAMRQLGWTHAAVQRLDVDDNRARALLLIDNRTSDLAGYDPAALADLLAGLPDWEGTGYEPDDLDALLAELAGLPGATVDQLGDPDALLPEDPAPSPPEPNLPPPSPPPTPPTPPPPPPPPASTPPPTPAPPPPRPTPTPAGTAPGDEVTFTLALRRDDRDELWRLIHTARTWLGTDLPPAEILLRALRALAAIGDARADPTRTISVAALARAAGDDPLPLT